jgi:hypothetical protein
VPLYKSLFLYYFLTRPEIKKFDFFCGHCGAIKKKVFEELGGFNAKLRWGIDLENDDFGERINKKYAIEANMKMQVRHNFPGFRRLTKLFFNRTFLWVKFFLLKKTFNNSVSTSANGIGAASSALSLFFVFIGIIYPSFLYVALGFLLIHLLIFAKFIHFVSKRRNIFSTLAMAIIHFYFSVIIGLAGILALVDSMQAKITGVELHGIKTDN